MRPIKIAMVSTVLPQTNFCAYLIGALQDHLGEQAQVLAVVNQDSRNTNVCLRNVHLIWDKNLLYPFQIVRFILSERCDLVHVHHEFNMYGGPVTVLFFPFLLLFLRLSRQTVAVSIHAVVAPQEVDVDFLRTFGWPAAKLLVPAVRLVFTYIFRSCCLLAHRIIVHASCLRETLVSCYGGHPTSITVIPHGVPHDLETQPPDPNAEIFQKEWFCQLQDRPFIISFGYLARRKGIEHLIEAFSMLPSQFADWALVIAGGTLQRDYELELRMLANEKDLTGRVVFTSFINEGDLDYLFRTALFAVLPGVYSVSASGPLALAIGYHKPVIVPRIGVFAEEVADGQEGLLYPPYDDYALAETLARLMADKELREQLAQAMAKKAVKRGWPKVAAETYRVYRNVLRIK